MDRRSTVLLRMAASGLLAGALFACGSTTDARGGFDESGDGQGAEDGDPGEATAAPGSGGTAPDPEKPGCAQAQYTEALPTTTSLSGLSFSSASADDYLLAALGKRFPLGKAIVEGGLSSPLAQSQGNCIERFLRDTSSAAAVLRQAPTIVHECGHFYDLGEGGGSTSAYVLRTDLTFSCKQGETTSRGGKTFARSLLKSDAYYPKREACGSNVAKGCDFYADVYLDGSATDGSFQGGDQGYSSLLEEASQYVNSLATALAFADQNPSSGGSHRDGILTFLWYLERYLKMAREDYPAAYALLSEDACWRQATLSVWDRGWFYLDATSGAKNLGFDDVALTTLVKDPTLTSEIDALRALECE